MYLFICFSTTLQMMFWMHICDRISLCSALGKESVRRRSSSSASTSSSSSSYTLLPSPPFSRAFWRHTDHLQQTKPWTSLCDVLTHSAPLLLSKKSKKKRSKKRKKPRGRRTGTQNQHANNGGALLGAALMSLMLCKCWEGKRAGAERSRAERRWRQWECLCVRGGR